MENLPHAPAPILRQSAAVRVTAPIDRMAIPRVAAPDGGGANMQTSARPRPRPINAPPIPAVDKQPLVSSTTEEGVSARMAESTGADPTSALVGAQQPIVSSADSVNAVVIPTKATSMTARPFVQLESDTDDDW